MGLCVFSLPISLLMIERIYIYIYNYLCYYHHQIGSMNYYPLFRVSSWNNGVRCMSFCILIGKYPCLIQVCKLLLQQTPRILRLSPPQKKKKKNKKQKTKKNPYIYHPPNTPTSDFFDELGTSQFQIYILGFHHRQLAPFPMDQIWIIREHALL